MSMQNIHDILKNYSDIWPKGVISYQGFRAEDEERIPKIILDFVEEQGPKALLRSCAKGHLTASALVVNPQLDKVLLMLHAKLGKWLQLGGHVDGDPDLAAAALREGREESGRNELEWIEWERFAIGTSYAFPLPFDCDVHEIPARKSEAAHLHYDLRYLCVLDETLPLVRNEESHELRWLDLREARLLTSEMSMLRQFAKLEALQPFYRP